MSGSKNSMYKMFGQKKVVSLKNELKSELWNYLKYKTDKIVIVFMLPMSGPRNQMYKRFDHCKVVKLYL